MINKDSFLIISSGFLVIVGFARKFSISGRTTGCSIVLIRMIHEILNFNCLSVLAIPAAPKVNENRTADGARSELLRNRLMKSRRINETIQNWAT